MAILKRELLKKNRALKQEIETGDINMIGEMKKLSGYK